MTWTGYGQDRIGVGRIVDWVAWTSLGEYFMFDKDLGYVQIICDSGIVHDVSNEVWEMVKLELDGDRLIEFEDIYEGTCWLFPVRFVTARSWNKRSGELYQELNNDGGEDGFQESKNG